MNEQELRTCLRGLRARADLHEFDDVASRQRLEALLLTIEQQAGGAVNRAHLQPLLANLSQAIARFEVGHPALTASLGDLASALSSMGI